MRGAVQEKHLPFPGTALAPGAMGAHFTNLASQPLEPQPQPQSLPIDLDPLFFGQDLREMGEVEIRISSFGQVNHLLLEFDTEGMKRPSTPVPMAHPRWAQLLDFLLDSFDLSSRQMQCCRCLHSAHLLLQDGLYHPVTRHLPHGKVHLCVHSGTSCPGSALLTDFREG